MKTLLRHLTAAALLACTPALHAADTVEFTADRFEFSETSDWAGAQIKRTGGQFNFQAGVRVVVEGGTAQEGTDFVLTQSIVESGAGGESWASIQPIDDGVPEPDETIVLRLAEPTNGLQLGPRIRTTVVLRNSKTEYRLMRPDGSNLIAPGDGFPVTLHEGASNSVSILRRGDRDQATAVDASFQAVDSFPDDYGPRAMAGVDFEPRAVQVSFAAGETNATVSVPIFDNGVVNDRYRYLDLEIFGVGTWNLQIEDNERPTHLDVTRTESDLLFDVEFDANFNPPERCWGDRNPDDRRHIGTLPDGRLVMDDPIGRVRLYFSDGRVDESFPAVHLTGFCNAALDLRLWLCDEPLLLAGASSVNGTDVDGDAGRSAIHLGKLPATALQLTAKGPNQFICGGTFRFIESTTHSNSTVAAGFIRLGPSTGPATVHYTTRDVTATAGKDYMAQSGTINFAPLETEKTIQIPILTDTEDEFDESLEVVVTAAEGFEALPAPMRLTILGKGPAPRLERVKRLRDGRVLLGGTGPQDTTRLEFSTDLKTWHPLTHPLGGFNGPDATWLDASATNAPTSFYRAVAP